MNYYLTVGLVSILGITACGGGGSKRDPSDAPPDWRKLINEDPTTFTEAELKDIYWGYAQLHYTGFDDPADVTAANVQKVAEIVFARSLDWLPQVDHSGLLRSAGVEDYSDYAASDPSPGVSVVDATLNCRMDGTVSLAGEVTDGEGILSVDYANCVDNVGLVNGDGALSLSVGSGFGAGSFPGVVFYKDVTHTGYDDKLRIDGHYTWGSERVAGQPSRTFSSSSLLFKDVDSGEQYLRTLEWENDAEHERVTQSGSLSMSTLGSMEFTSEETERSDDQGVYQRMTFIGANDALAALDFTWASVKLTLDYDADGEVDQGRYFLGFDEFLENDFTENPLVDVSEMDHPPVPRAAPLIANIPETGEAIEVTLSYFDPDTEEQNIDVVVFWKINGSAVTDVSGPVLPAGMTEEGDKVEIYFQVSDATQTVISATTEITISSEF